MITHHGALSSHKEGAWTPVISSTAGAIASSTASAEFIKDGRKVTVTINATITNNGTGSGVLKIANLPYPVDALHHVGSGLNAITGKGLVWYGYQGSSDSFIRYQDGTYPAATNDQVWATLTYMTTA